MPKLIISRNAQVVQEVELDKERTTIGRHPSNDIVIEHGTVSGRHAAIILAGNEAVLEDLGSTNGTFVNGKRIERQRLASGDRAVIALFQLEFMAPPAATAAPAQVAPQAAPRVEPVAAVAPAPAPSPSPSPSPAPAPAPAPAMAARPAAPAPAAPPPAPSAAPVAVPAQAAIAPGNAAVIEVMSGVNAGKTLPLVKPLTTLGSPGVLVVVIARQGNAYTLSQIDGGTSPLVNGVAIPKDGRPLADGDMINLAGTSMRFCAAR